MARERRFLPSWVVVVMTSLMMHLTTTPGWWSPEGRRGGVALAAHLMRSVPGVLPTTRDDGSGLKKRTETTGHGIGHGSGRSLVRHGPMRSKPQVHSLRTGIVSVSSYTPNGYYYGKEGKGGGRKGERWQEGVWKGMRASRSAPSCVFFI